MRCLASLLKSKLRTSGLPARPTPHTPGITTSSRPSDPAAAAPRPNLPVTGADDHAAARARGDDGGEEAQVGSLQGHGDQLAVGVSGQVGGALLGRGRRRADGWARMQGMRGPGPALRLRRGGWELEGPHTRTPHTLTTTTRPPLLRHGPHLRLRLSCQRGVVHLHVNGAEHADVGRHLVAVTQVHDVACSEARVG